MPPGQLGLLAGLEHGRTIPLAAVSRVEISQCGEPLTRSFRYSLNCSSRFGYPAACAPVKAAKAEKSVGNYLHAQDYMGSGRDFAAWIGLAPRQDSTGGKQKLGPISKQGDRYLRRILVVGAHSVLRRAKQNPEKYLWLTQLLARRPFKVVAVALANKMARMAWALLAHGGTSGAYGCGSGVRSLAMEG